MSSQKKKKLKAIDLFAGCGGLSDGFHQSGLFDFIAHVEWEKSECETLKSRLENKWKIKDSNLKVIRFDIQRTKDLLNGWKNDRNYGSHIGLKQLVKDSDGIDVVIGGPPCQAYSVAGRIRDEHGMQYDYRNYLFESYVEIVRYFKPKLFLFENVPGILSAKPGGMSIIERITKAFNNIGYILIDNLNEFANFDLTNFGIPQKRKRVIILGISNKLFGSNCQSQLNDFYNKILMQFSTAKTVTVKQAIGELQGFLPAESDYYLNGKKYSHIPSKDGIPNHYPRYHNNRDIRIFRKLAEDIEKKKFKYISIEAIKNLYTEETGKVSNIHKYYVLRWNEPSNTIPAHLFKDGLRHIHPDSKQARTLTPREAARLQTFDDDFVFYGSQTDQYRMIGNAVPPYFAKLLANAVYQFLESSRTIYL